MTDGKPVELTREKVARDLVNIIRAELHMKLQTLDALIHSEELCDATRYADGKKSALTKCESLASEVRALLNEFESEQRKLHNLIHDGHRRWRE